VRLFKFIIVSLTLLPATFAVSQQEMPTTDATRTTMLEHSSTSKLWVSGQMNFIFQSHPAFYAPYNGPNSLHPSYEKCR